MDKTKEQLEKLREVAEASLTNNYTSTTFL